MDQRVTLERPAEIEGIALHSGARVHLRLVPAEATTGIVFVRSDAAGARIPATLDNTAPSFYATVLERDGVRVSTVEHLMAALSALRIDDVEVELDGPEVPILDGSAAPFIAALLAAGRAPLPVPREYLTLTRPIVVIHDDKRIAAYPSGECRVTYAIDFDHPVLGYQELSVGVWREHEFEQKVAPARTFTFERDVLRLRADGLARGGSLDNAVVLGDDRVLNGELRFPDEFVRHKILDLTGDLALLGRPLRAHVVAFRGGHDLHQRLARKIWASRDSWYLAPWSEERPNLEATAHG